MSDDTYSSDCDIVLDYLSGACTEEEREAFERHLTYCKSCRARACRIADRMGGASLGYRKN